MSHEPTRDEWGAAVKAHLEHQRVLGPGPHMCAALTAANAIRDRRIRNEVLEEAARAADREGLRLRNEWGDVKQALGTQYAANAIRAERERAEKAERTLQIYAGDLTTAQLEADREHERATAAEAERDRLRDALAPGPMLSFPDFLEWIALRLTHFHHESPNVDFVLSLQERAKAIRKALARKTDVAPVVGGAQP